MSAELQTETQKVINLVVDCLLADGWRANSGWGQQPGTEPDAWTTAETILILRKIRKHSREYKRPDAAHLDKIISAACDILPDQQHEDGGWGLTNSNPPSTAFAAMVLADDEKHIDRIQRGVQYLSSSRNCAEDLGRGGWAMAGGLGSSIPVTCIVTSTLNVLERKIGPNLLQLEYLDPARSFLLHYQNPDGGWGSYISDPSAARPTAHVVYFLACAYGDDQDIQPALRQGVRWLKRNFNAREGSWGSAIEATTLTILALLAVGVSPHAPYFAPAIRYLLKNCDYERDAVGWGKIPDAPISTWATCYVLMALITYLDAYQHTERRGAKLRGSLEDLLYNRAASNVLTIVLLLVALVLLAASLLASPELQTILTIIGTVVGVIDILYTLLRVIMNRS
ncbi:MAG: terpene cyclase/mutase family protein [Anaerolineae bacterium]|nr:terpene cyclase/mutase family protein [Anaerolineae bacterium]